MPDKSRKLFALAIVLFILACQSNAVIEVTATPLPAKAASTNLPQATSTPLPTVIPTNTDLPLTDAARVLLTEARVTVLSGDVDANAEKLWVFGALEGQTIFANLATNPANGAVFSILGADGTVLLSETSGAPSWKGIAPAAQDYYIKVHSISTQNITFTLSVTILPQIPPKGTRIRFLPNTVGWQTTGILPPNTTKRYIFAAMGGQQMNVSLSTDPANSAFLFIWSADGTVYTLSAPAQTWSGMLTANQDYYVEVRSTSAQNITFHIDVEIPPAISTPIPLETPTPP